MSPTASQGGRNWRKPTFSNANGQKLPKKSDRRRATEEAVLADSPSVTSDEDQVDYRNMGNMECDASILNYVAVKRPENLISAEHKAPVMVDLHRPPGKQQLRRGPNTFTIDIMLRDPQSAEHPGHEHFPLARVHEVRASHRFKPSKVRPKDIHDVCQQNDIPLETLDPTTQAILCDQAVLSVNGINGCAAQEEVSAAAKTAEFSGIVEKLRRAARDQQAGSQDRETAQAQRKIVHRQARSGSSNDSGVVVKFPSQSCSSQGSLQGSSQDSSQGSSQSVRSRGSSTSLNPTAAEFVTQPARLVDPAIIEQSCNGRVERADLASVEKTIDKQLAIAQAFNDIANYSRDSLDNLHEVVRNTIQRYGFPTSGSGTANLASCGGDWSFGGQPPGLPVVGQTPFNMGGLLAPHGSFGMAAGDFPMCPPLPEALLPPFSGIGLPPPPFMPQPGPFLPPGLLSHQAGPFPAPGLAGFVPPCNPPPGFGLAPNQPVSGPSMNPWAGIPGPSLTKLVPPPKPRSPNAMSQQEYEAHIEWRKANEPGYALKCRERQARRNIRSNRSSVDFGSSESGATS